jgi:hypothetical protein
LVGATCDPAGVTVEAAVGPPASGNSSVPGLSHPAPAIEWGSASAIEWGSAHDVPIIGGGCTAGRLDPGVSVDPRGTSVSRDPRIALAIPVVR